MSLPYQVFRSCAPHQKNICRLHSIQILNQKICGGAAARGLHSLTLMSDRTDISKKFDNGRINHWTREKLLGNKAPLLASIIIARNESTNSSAFSNVETTRSLEAASTTTTEELSPATTASAELGTAPEATLAAQSSTLEVISEIPSSPVQSVEVSQEALIFESIPEPPAIPLVDEVTGAILGEPTFASLGLGGWSPSGIVQQCLEYFHVTLGMPWWAAILTGTIIVRALMFPLVVRSQRNAAKMQNYMPELQALQTKMTEARHTGNALMSAKYGQDMALFMKEKDINPLKSMMLPLAMAPVFISFFFGLRKMANLPVESLKEGGMFWFTDLTLADPFYILPLITSVTVWITLELGADGVRLNSTQHGNLVKYIFRAIPVIMFPFTLNFPAAILCYWVSTNAISLVQVSLLKIPAVREKLKIEPLRKISPDMLPASAKKGFRESFKESWTNMKISREIEERQKYDEISFQRAGRGPIPKTYKYDPTKSDPQAIQAKQK